MRMNKLQNIWKHKKGVCFAVFMLSDETTFPIAIFYYPLKHQLAPKASPFQPTHTLIKHNTLL